MIIKELKKNWRQILIFVVLIILFIVLCVKNYHNGKFWEASLIDIMTISVASFITFLLSERMNDVRRRNDCIEHVILEIEEMIINDSIFLNDRNVTLMKQTSCANRIKYLKDARFSDFQDDINFIETHFQEIRDLYSSHENKLDEVIDDFRRHQCFICDKCSKIRIGLYS